MTTSTTREVHLYLTILQIENKQTDKVSDRVDAKDFIFKKHNSIFHDFQNAIRI